MARNLAPDSMYSNQHGSSSHHRVAQLGSLAILLLIVLAPLGAANGAAPATQAQTLADDFTNDTSLNAALWEVNGPVALSFSGENCPGCSVVPLTPTFSSAGMKIASVTGSLEVGAIQSVQSFTPPLTVTALVEGIVSDGHPFVFGVSSQDSTSGVQITGNLNPNDCSAGTNCGNPSTCGTPASSSVSPNQCYYGIYARAGTTGGAWQKTPALDLTPAVGVVYTVTIAVDGSGTAQFNVTAAGQILGQETTQVGTGPLYVIMGQSEGAPVPGPGPNSAVWSSVAVIPSATLSPPGSTPSSGISSIEWDFIVILVIVGVLIAVVAWSRRGRGLSVTVLDSGTLSPISGAAVSADGPRSYSGTTAANGTAIFVAVRPGEYSVNAVAPGYVAIRPERIVIRKSAAHTLRLGSITESAPVGMTPLTPATGPNHPHVEPTVSTVQPLRPALAPGIAAMPPTGTPPGEASAGAGDDFGGERIREIIRTFRTKGALSPETALPAEELGLSRIFVRIMKRRRGKTKVFIEVNGKYYLDENALRGMS